MRFLLACEDALVPSFKLRFKQSKKCLKFVQNREKQRKINQKYEIRIKELLNEVCWRIGRKDEVNFTMFLSISQSRTFCVLKI